MTLDCLNEDLRAEGKIPLFLNAEVKLQSGAYLEWRKMELVSKDKYFKLLYSCRRSIKPRPCCLMHDLQDMMSPLVQTAVFIAWNSLFINTRGELWDEGLYFRPEKFCQLQLSMATTQS